MNRRELKALNAELIELLGSIRDQIDEALEQIDNDDLLEAADDEMED